MRLPVAGLLALSSEPARAPDWAVAVLPSGAEISLEIAADDASRRRGYMFRESVAEGEGMLFIFDGAGHHGIWMKNCKVALDIIWMDDAFRVVEIAHDREPCPEDGDCPSLVPMRNATYVLEVTAGTARAQKLGIGDRIQVLTAGPLRR